jgi:hypothetical protein
MHYFFFQWNKCGEREELKNEFGTNLALAFPQCCHCGELFVILLRTELGESSLLKSVTYYTFVFICLFFVCLRQLEGTREIVSCRAHVFLKRDISQKTF